MKSKQHAQISLETGIKKCLENKWCDIDIILRLLSNQVISRKQKENRCNLTLLTTIKFLLNNTLK